MANCLSGDSQASDKQPAVDGLCDVRRRRCSTSSRRRRNPRLQSGGAMIRVRFAVMFCLLVVLATFRTANVPALAAPVAESPRHDVDDHQKGTRGQFTVDVALDGRTWRMND